MNTPPFCNTHYSHYCGCVATSAPPAVLSLSAVWVVVEIYSKAVQLSREAATTPISGRLAIFQRPEVTRQVAAKILGVFEKESQARLMVQANQKEGSEFIVERRSICSDFSPVHPTAPPPENHCIMCGTPWPTTYCKKCEKARNDEMRERDMGIITEIVPASV